MHYHWLRDTRHRLANANSLIHLSILGVLSGISCSLVILLFRYLIETPSSLWLPGGDADNFEALPNWLHFALPLSGALLLGFILRKMAVADTRTGIVHVLTRLHVDHGHLPLKNALVQFFGGALAVITGQSGGREGPAIHLGAATNSLIGQKLRLPNNSIRMLVGCGTSAAIAASFNTPIAGVIFAMEVIMMEYTVAGFIPVMLAAITGTIMSRAIYGGDLLFDIPAIEMASLWEVPFIIFLGLVIGSCAALFMKILKLSLHFADRPIMQRFAMAGLVTGCCALMVPEVMGIGYDSLNAALNSELSLQLMFALIAAKIIATAVSTGMGMPIGLIGPNILIGACIGSALGGLGAYFFPELSSQRSFYVLLGMGAMMGAVLNAPLAALMALLELSNNTTMIFPGMLAITVATLTNSEIFKQRSAHQTALFQLKQLLPTDPVSLALQRTSVASIMQRNIATTMNQVTLEEAQTLAEKPYLWYVIGGNDDKLQLSHGDDLRQHIETRLKTDPGPLIELTGAHTEQVMELHIQATLREALTVMNKHEVDTLYVSGYLTGGRSPVSSLDLGIITRADIEKHNNTPQSF
ncbi:chloride channel protein [Oceanicoccus sagamiensis]|uniref:Chloride channel protein EriC n=1 Tax=Oceanicoccus sagamiensis TaxID=716816 RepID=A0A1X9N9V9_9GAMM|nr:chloride channel protein [Oceanicoccus sagamiensis]ARN74426.1 chloride channel protein EriC [Oceanicoccus sagamiensis]